MSHIIMSDHREHTWTPNNPWILDQFLCFTKKTAGHFPSTLTKLNYMVKGQTPHDKVRHKQDCQLFFSFFLWDERLVSPLFCCGIQSLTKDSRPHLLVSSHSDNYSKRGSGLLIIHIGPRFTIPQYTAWYGQYVPVQQRTGTSNMSAHPHVPYEGKLGTTQYSLIHIIPIAIQYIGMDW